jgi:predicted transcriptional regulator
LCGVDIERLASHRRDSETAAMRQLVAAVGIERWGQRAGRIATLLEKHPVAVSRWVAEAARARQVDPGIEESMTKLDAELSSWALTARANGALAPRELSD